MEKAVDVGMVLDREFDALKLDVQTQLSDDELLSQKYPAKSHARKVVSELQQGGAEGIDSGVIFLPGEPTRMYENSDQGPDFRQRRYFYYITGFDFADCAVTYEIASDKLTLWIPYVEPRMVLYFGTVPDPAEVMRRYDVDNVCYRKDLLPFLRSATDQSSTLFVLDKHQTPRALNALIFTSGDKCPKVDSVNLKPAMDRARVIKDAHEIALIRRANKISSIAHREVARHFLRLRNEQDVEAIIHAACTARGAHSQAYHIIAGSGPNASTLHYDANNEPLAGRELMVLDAGCEFRCYASDITRTLPISGSFSGQAASIYAVVERMQEECIESIRPGTKFLDLHLLAANIAANGLLRLGILKGDRKKVEASRVVSAFFPHGLGHHVGLETHDVNGDLRLLHASRRDVGKREIVTAEILEEFERSSEGKTLDQDDRQALLPGMIVTVEPGIYFNRAYIHGNYLSKPELAQFIDTNVLEKYYPLGGVRIEDDILVTKDGYENLTTAPKGEELLDIINGTYEFI